MSLTLPKKPPRDYPLIEAFRGRVWRNGWALYGREVSLFGAGLALFAFLLDGLLWLEVGLLALIVSVVLSGLGTLWANMRRARLVRIGVTVNGHIIARQRLLLWHELLRGRAHRSFYVRYRFTPVGQEDPCEGRLYLCRCAYEQLSTSDQLLIAYDQDAPKKSLPLRVAVMRIPH
jgi:hypothetical protein